MLVFLQLPLTDGGIKCWGFRSASFSTEAKETYEKSTLQITSTPIFYDRVLAAFVFSFVKKIKLISLVCNSFIIKCIKKFIKFFTANLKCLKAQIFNSIKSSKPDICKVVFSKIIKLSDRNNLFI